MSKLSKLVVVNSLAVSAKLERYIPATKLHLAYCATVVDWPSLNTSELPPSPTLLMAGAISEGKGQHLVIEALALPEANGVDLVIAGSGPQGFIAKLQSRIKELRLQNRVRFIPFVKDRRELYKLGNALVVASRSEAFGRVAVEAQKSGLPVLMADAGAAHEVVEDGETGLLFDSQHSASWRQLSEGLYGEAGLYEKLREKGQASAFERFGLSQHMLQINQALAAL